MPSSEMELVLEDSIEKVWDTVADLAQLGPCLGFVSRVELSPEGHPRWFIKFPMSRTTRTSYLDPQFTEIEPYQRLCFEGKGPHLIWGGSIALEPDPTGGTKAKIRLEVQGLGPMATVINPMAQIQIGGQTKAFGERLKERLRGKGG